jgi:hypothetical protein
MAKSFFLCKYCGNEWYGIMFFDEIPVCAKCGDRRIRIRKDVKDVDYYEDEPRVEKVKSDYAEDDG